MIEREDYCIDILQQTAALRAAVDAVSLLLMEDHVAGCLATAVKTGDAGGLYRRGDGGRAPEHGPTGKGPHRPTDRGYRASSTIAGIASGRFLHNRATHSRSRGKAG